MATSTTRLALLEPATSDAPSEIRLAITNHATTLDSAALDTQGTAVSRPVAATSGRYYESTDTGALDRDNGTAWNNIISAGDLKLSAASIAPSGWLLCDGSAVSRTAFAVLFAALGTTYGVGDGSTTFNVPDCRGRTLIGAGAGPGLTARVRGQAFGEETHALSGPEGPVHNHGGGTGNDSPDHTHLLAVPPNGVLMAGHEVLATTFDAGGTAISGSTGVSQMSYYAGGVSTNGASVRHTHSIANDGSGSAHNNMQPYWVANVLIKT